MNDIGFFATSVWDNLGEPLSPTVSYISGWAGSNIGRLNILLNTAFVNSGGYFSPSFGNAESGIYEEMFNVKYYESRARSAIHGTLDVSGQLPWVSIKEGDTTITRSNPNEVMKTYLSLKRDSESHLNRLVLSYKRNLAMPQQVVPELDGNESY